MQLGFARYRFPATGLARGFLSTAYYLHKQLDRHPKVCLIDYHGVAPALIPSTVLHVTPYQWFRPVSGKRNVLFTMWEADDLPKDFIEAARLADMLIVPSEHNRRVFEAHGFEGVKVAPLGVSSEYRKVGLDRDRLAGPGGGKPLTYLFVGSQSDRKGWPLLGPAWEKAFNSERDNVRLYIKTTTLDGSRGRITSGFGGRVTIDTRDVEPIDLLRLQASADVFVFPSFGEGFGLPPLEAMAAGCLAVATANTGLATFIDSEHAVKLNESAVAKLQYGTDVLREIPIPSVDDLAEGLVRAYDEWGTPELELVRQAGAIRARSFTWQNSADMIVRALEESAAV